MVLFLQLQKIFRQLLCGGVRIQVVASCPKLCCPIESGHVPRRMLSGIANGDLRRLLGIAFQNQPHMPEHGFHAFFQRRRHYQFAGHCRLNLPKQKRIPIGAPSCHDQITAGLLIQCKAVRRSLHIAVADDGNGHCLLDFPNGVPVGFAAVQLGFGSAVYGNCGGTGQLPLPVQRGRR